MDKKHKKIISDYYPVIFGSIIMGAGMTLDFYGVQGAGIFGVVAFMILAIYQAVLPRIELNKYKTTIPNIVVKNAYIKKNVETTDFVYFDPKSGDVQNRYSGGTVGAWEYKPTIRNKHGSTDNSEVETTQQTYVVIDFANEPEAKIEGQDAIDVIAKIQYKDVQGNSILGKVIKGLWQGNEPSRYVSQKQDYEFTQTTLPANGDIRSLCVVIKNAFDEDCYAYSLESYTNSIFLKKEELKLGRGVIEIEVFVNAKNFISGKTFTFRVVNAGKNRELSITAT